MAVLFVSTIFAAATGIVGASVTILGIMAAKTMNRSGYDVKLAAGTITAGGTLGILIPPSDHAGGDGADPGGAGHRSLRRRGGAGHSCSPSSTPATRSLRCQLNPALGPPLPEDERPETSGSKWLEFIAAIVVPVALFVAATFVVHQAAAAALLGQRLLHRLLALVIYLAVYAAIFFALMRAHRWLLAN